MTRVGLACVSDVMPNTVRHPPYMHTRTKVVRYESRGFQRDTQVFKETTPCVFDRVFDRGLYARSVLSGFDAESYKVFVTGASQRKNAVYEPPTTCSKLHDFKIEAISVGKSLGGSLTLDVSVCRNTWLWGSTDVCRPTTRLGGTIDCRHVTRDVEQEHSVECERFGDDWWLCNKHHGLAVVVHPRAFEGHL